MIHNFDSTINQRLQRPRPDTLLLYIPIFGNITLKRCEFIQFTILVDHAKAIPYRSVEGVGHILRFSQRDAPLQRASSDMVEAHLLHAEDDANLSRSVPECKRR